MIVLVVVYWYRNVQCALMMGVDFLYSFPVTEVADLVESARADLRVVEVLRYIWLSNTNVIEWKQAETS